MILSTLDLAFLFLDFVAAEVFLGLSENNMLSQDWVIFAEAQLVWSIHRVFLGVILTNARFLRNQTDEFALSIILLCHNTLYFITTFLKSKQENPASRWMPERLDLERVFEIVAEILRISNNCDGKGIAWYIFSSDAEVGFAIVSDDDAVGVT